MAKILEPILPTLASLPTPLATQFKAFATLIFSRKIEIIHCEKRTRFHEETPDFYSSSTRIEFKLTCKEEYVSNPIFKEQRDKAKTIVEETKKSLRNTILEVQKMEETGAKERINSDFIRGLLDIFELYSCYTRTANKTIDLPYDDKDASEILLQKFFYDYCNNQNMTANTNYFEFLHFNKKYVLTQLTQRKSKVPFLNTEEICDEEMTASNLFNNNAKKDFFPLINKITIDLVNHHRKVGLNGLYFYILS